MGQPGQDVSSDTEATPGATEEKPAEKPEIVVDSPAEKPAAEKPAAEKPAAEKPAAEKIDPEKLALQARVQELEAANQALEARLRTVSAAWRERQDEIAGARERLARQAQIEEEIRRGEVVTSVFEPVENLARSIQASKNLPEETVHGLRMIHQDFMQALRKLGLEEISGTGAAFDPSVHEAIATMPAPDPAQDNTVAQVYSTGYRIGKRLVRPARVVIYSAQ